MNEANLDRTEPAKRAGAAAKTTVTRSGTKRTGGTKFASKTKATDATRKAAAKTTAAKISNAGAAKALGGTRRAATPARATTVGRATSWQPDVRASQVVRVLGNRRAAALLGVAESQPSRWRKALEVPSSQVAPMLVDLDHIIARLQLIWDEEVIGDWLEGTNTFLDGARPIDVLRVNGSVPVLEAIEAEAAGAYA
ncbi:MAG: hypothetical protein ACYDGN_16915 [Acidimicrobiales bacterium]